MSIKARVKKYRKKFRSFIDRNLYGFSCSDLKNCLIRCDIKAGDCLLVHSSLNRFGGFSGQPIDILQMLESLVGVSGCVAMPTIPFSGSSEDYVSTKPIFDVTRKGLMGIGQITGRDEYILGAKKTAESLRKLMSPEGFIPGRIDNNFNGSVKWCCLTGTAQTSIVWSELYQITGDEKWSQSRGLANHYLMQRHFIKHPNDFLRGGVFGSWPIWGDYGKWMILNWATKFFIDALLLGNKERP